MWNDLEKSSIKTVTGRMVPILTMEPHHVDLYDIAHALSMKCRFGGHSKTFYSVAEHSVRVLDLCEDWCATPIEQFHAIFHDATEAYIPDFAQPTKWAAHFIVDTRGEPEVVSARRLEDRIYATIVDKFNGYPANPELPQQVKRADRVLAVTEARDLMNVTPGTWKGWPPPIDERITPWPQERARQLFLERASAVVAALNPVTH